MPDEVTLDTTVLRRANVALQGDRATANLLARRLTLLRRIRAKEICVLVSQNLIQEYSRQLLPFQNDFVRSFLELVSKPDGARVVVNWKVPWSGGDRSRARGCRYPAEDDHVLRTAIRNQPTIIFSEEDRMLRTDACIYREFRVHIQRP
jgi:hypothetical protein